MSTPAQVAANQANCQHSTGPTSAEGKATISMNAVRHGLAGAFMFLPGEKPQDFDKLHDGLRAEHNPETPTETLLVESMVQHYWLQQRALRLQSLCFDDAGVCNAEKELGLYLRYQTTHERAFYKSLNTLLKLRAEKCKAEIGFVSQQAEQNRACQQAELTEARVRLANAKAQHLEIDSDIRQTIEAPLPGHMRIPFEDLSAMFKMAVDHVNRELKAKQAA